MTDEQDGLDALGFHQSEPEPSPRREWWLAAGSLRFAIVALSLWVVLLGLRVFRAFFDRSVDAFGWIALVCYFAGTILYIPSVVHFARLRSRTGQR
jgi:hypothetical protein